MNYKFLDMSGFENEKIQRIGLSKKTFSTSQILNSRKAQCVVFLKENLDLLEFEKLAFKKLRFGSLSTLANDKFPFFVLFN